MEAFFVSDGQHVLHSIASASGCGWPAHGWQRSVSLVFVAFTAFACRRPFFAIVPSLCLCWGLVVCESIPDGPMEKKSLRVVKRDSCVGAMCSKCDLLTQTRGVAVFLQPRHPGGRFRRMGPLGAQVAVSGGAHHPGGRFQVRGPRPSRAC